MGALATTLPPPFNDYLTILARYSQIYKTLVADYCVLVFLVGIAEVWAAIWVGTKP